MIYLNKNDVFGRYPSQCHHTCCTLWLSFDVQKALCLCAGCVVNYTTPTRTPTRTRRKITLHLIQTAFWLPGCSGPIQIRKLGADRVLSLPYQCCGWGYCHPQRRHYLRTHMIHHAEYVMHDFESWETGNTLRLNVWDTHWPHVCTLYLFAVQQPNPLLRTAMYHGVSQCSTQGKK